MGMTQRNGGSGTVPVNVRPSVKTCPEEAGVAELNLEDGTKVFVLGHIFYPSHDRPAIAAIHKMLRDQRDLEASRPEAERNRIVVMLMGGILHEEAFKQVIDEQDHATKLLRTKVVPEIAAIREQYRDGSFEDRFLALAKLGGEFIASFAESCGGHVIYVPSVTGMLPNEVDFMRFVLEKKAQLDKRADKFPTEGQKGERIPEDIAEFLGLKDHPQVLVQPFGSAIEVNDDMRYVIGDFRLRTPGSAAHKEAMENSTNMSVCRTFDGTSSSAHFTSPNHTLGGAHRFYWQAHEVPVLFDIKAQLGYLRKYQLRGKGFWAGKIVGTKINGRVIELAKGKTGLRSFFVFGRVYQEDEVFEQAKRFKLALPALGKASASAKPAEAAPAAKAAPAKPKQTSTAKPAKKAAGTSRRSEKQK
jgi:hypothetical protein